MARLKVLIGLGITIAFLWLLFTQLDIASLKAALSGLSLSLILMALSLLLIAYSFRVVRWWWMLRSLEPELPLQACIWPFVSSIAVNNVLPFRAGDALRVFAFRKQLRSPASRVLGTMIIERLLDLLVLLGFFFLGLLSLPDGALPNHFVQIAIWLAGASLGGLATLLLLTPWLPRFIAYLAKLPAIEQHQLAEPILRHGTHLTESLALIRSPVRLSGLLMLSVFAWAFEGAIFATLASIIGQNLPTIAPWFAMGTGTLATLIPSSPGYFGTFDYFTAQGLVAYGATFDAAAAFALSVHAVLWLPLTAAGLLYLFIRGTRFWAPLPNPTSKKDEIDA